MRTSMSERTAVVKTYMTTCSQTPTRAEQPLSVIDQETHDPSTKKLNLPFHLAMT